MSAQVHAHPKITPIFPVRDMTEAREFWTRAGGTVELYDTGYAFVLVNGAEVAHLDLRPDLDVTANATACYLHVGDPHVWHARWQAAGLPVTELKAEPWGMTAATARRRHPRAKTRPHSTRVIRAPWRQWRQSTPVTSPSYASCSPSTRR